MKKRTSVGYFGRKGVLEAMRHEHYYLWLEMLKFSKKQLKPHMFVVDFGCSTGEFLRVLNRGLSRPFSKLAPMISIGLDLPEIIASCTEIHRRERGELPVVLCSATLSNFQSDIDFLFSHEVCYLLPDIQQWAKDLYRALAPGGSFCISTMGCIEHPYFRRWQPIFSHRKIETFGRSIIEYCDAFKAAGFRSVKSGTLRLSQHTYRRWRRQHPDFDTEWFLSAADEFVYFVEIGKPIFCGVKPK